MTSRFHRRAVPGTLAAFAVVVTVASATAPGPPPAAVAAPGRTAVVLSPGASNPVPRAAVVRRVGGPYEAQAAVLALVAHGYTAVVGVGPEARAAIEQARTLSPRAQLLGR